MVRTKQNFQCIIKIIITMKLAMEEWLLTSASASFTELKALNYLLA